MSLGHLIGDIVHAGNDAANDILQDLVGPFLNIPQQISDAGHDIYNVGKDIVDFITPAKKRKRDDGISPNEDITRRPTPITPGKAPVDNTPTGTEEEMHRRINTGGPAGANSGDEVPVAKVPRLISKIHPDHFTVRLPFFIHAAFPGSSCTAVNTTPLLLLRLNSIYDPLQQAHTTATPAIDADSQPNGRQIWDTHFKYYRVLRSDVKLTYINRAMNQGVGTVPQNGMIAVGYELIDENAAVSNNVNMFMTTKHAVRDVMLPSKIGFIEVLAGTDNYYSQSPTFHVMTHTYTPETWTHHVEKSGSEERWTPIGANPNVDHNLAVRAMHLDSSVNPTPDANMFGVIVQIEYEVQFMEQTDAFFKTANTATATYPDSGGGTDS